MIGRVRHRREFEELSRGRRARTETLWCRYVDDPQLVPPRLAFAIGRAVGPAVRRNRLRRRLRAIVRAAASPGGRLDHGGLLIGAAPAAVEQSFAQLRDEVGRLLDAVSNARRGVADE
ncbi:MAG: ribonuclease P protein component [Ilumatobacteraceae bacterium]